MPIASWHTYRIGARLQSLDSLVSAQSDDQILRLHRALSTVAYLPCTALPIKSQRPSLDDQFVGRLLLGLLSRGWPTLSSPRVEQSLLDSLDPEAGFVCHRKMDQAVIEWQLDCDPGVLPAACEEAVRGALLRGDDRLTIDEATVWQLTDSDEEYRFYRDYLSPMLGQAIGWLELQRPIATMVREDAPGPMKIGSGRVDFALDLPGTNGPIRLVIELDGPHHLTPQQRQQDKFRDDFLAKHGWETRRVPVSTLRDGSLNNLPGVLEAIVRQNPFPFTHIDEGTEALEDPLRREVTRLILTPHAIARMQLALCRALMDGTLQLSAPSWTVAVVEREVPCAELAVRDWLETLSHLCRLYAIPLRTTDIRLLIAEDHLTSFRTPIWSGPRSSTPQLRVERILQNQNPYEIDLAIDVSVGAHPTRRYPTDPLDAANLLIKGRVQLRTAQRQSGYLVDTWDEPRIIADPAAVQESLVYFLQALFRKSQFRPGQLAIMERVLRRQDVIGLLPTGAGKSITFQLPALLSPGLTLVIDPIKSLMQDQVENLAQVGIMDAIQINSDTAPAERERIEWQFGQGEYRLVFISPERLQIKRFRELLTATASNRPIAYLVIDEAHCVSEWGHDFRTAYLHLGRVAKDYCGCGGKRPPMIAVTGTASEAVLQDIRRELDIETLDAIVRPNRFDRDELKFEIVKVEKQEKVSALAQLIGHVIPARLGVEPNVLASGACGGIVFSPHVNGTLGVCEVAQAIPRLLPHFQRDGVTSPTSENALVAFFSGEPPKQSQMTQTQFAGWKARVQRDFKSGRIPLLVATSAFGMGIDKPNIRFTVHLAMPKSVEALAQESGRAGRDRHDAVCAVLFTDRLAPSTDPAIQPPEDTLEPGISIEEAQRRAASAGWNSDDAEMQMFLHSRSYQGALRESAAVRAFFHNWIEPRIFTSKNVPGAAIEIDICDSDYHINIEPAMAAELGKQVTAPKAHEIMSETTAEDSSWNLPRPDIQRLIYRLSLLGIIVDYTISYHAGNNYYKLTVQAISDDAVVDHLFRYVARYRTSALARPVKERFESSSLGNTICRCIDTLCWFVYEEIEQRRRQGIYNIRQMLRDSSDGTDFARRLNEALSYNSLTRDVFALLATDDYRSWALVSNAITAADSAEQVYYQCSRALEDAPGHPGLLLLLALAAQGSDGRRRDEVITILHSGFQQVRKLFSDDDQRKVAEWLVPELARIRPDAAPEVLSQVVLNDRDSVLAGAVLRSVDAGTIAPEPTLVDVSQRCILHTIDTRLDQFMKG